MPTTMTLERHILTAQQDHPEATGTLTSLLYDIALASKVVAREATRTNILEMVEDPTDRLPRAEKLAEFADTAMVEIIRRAGRVSVIASEHHDQIIPVPGDSAGRYVLMLDPLDGVSPTDYTVSVGAIFGIFRRPDASAAVSEQDCLQKGRNLVAAGYVLFGSSTVMVYSIGQGVHGFALDPGLGEFLLSHDQIRIPSPPRYYSVNHAHDDFWSPGIRRFVRYLQGKDSAFLGGLSLRYTGSLVADFHRNLIAGGIFCYPADTVYPEGKMRLNFEANPLAFLAEQAGGAANNGSGPILDIEPKTLHQRTPFFIGNCELVENVRSLYSASRFKSEPWLSKITSPTRTRNGVENSSLGGVWHDQAFNTRCLYSFDQSAAFRARLQAGYARQRRDAQRGPADTR